nr:iron ABC transporter permease [Anaerolineae bacterium]
MTGPSSTASGWPELGLRPAALIGLLAVLALIFLVSLAVGSVSIPLRDVLAILLGGDPAKATWMTIVLDFRLPRAITAALAGAALGVAGLQMQTLFRNPLADPFVLGISSGASLGVALVVLATSGMLAAGGTTLLSGLGLLGNFGVTVAASIGAAAVMVIVMLASQRVPTMTLLILGLMFGYITGAVVSILVYFSIADRIQTYIAWTFGSFSGTTWKELKVFIPVLVLGIGMAQVMVKALNALLLGENYARSMGLAVRRARFWSIASTSLLAGAVTAFCGPISFLGIAVPHLCRSLLNTSDHRVLVPAVTLLGGILALVADLIARVPGADLVLPLNAIMALIGAPIVIWVILRQRNIKASFGD